MTWEEQLYSAAETTPDDACAAIDVAVRYGSRLALPGSGSTRQRWQVLYEVAARDLTSARVFEAHTDALAILAEAGMAPPAGSWGVFAAEAPGARLDARRGADGWTLTGTKAWCSLGGSLDHALVTAHTTEGRALFAVNLRGAGVRAAEPAGWVARGLRTVTSVPVHFTAAAATPVGEGDWYLTRPGFAWGGIGVAACWLGGAQALHEALRHAARSRPAPLREMHVGAVDAALFGAGAALAAAVSVIDAGEADAPAVLAHRVRTVVADAAELTLKHAAHALGPGPMAFDAAYARRIADLGLYVRQHHGEGDLAALGALVAESEVVSAW